MQNNKELEHQKAERTVIDGLWNIHVTSDSYGSRQQYYAHMFEQYKLYVESADRISARRNTANTFFLTLHTIFLTGSGFALASRNTLQSLNDWVIFFTLIPVIVLCYVWWRLIKSYRQLNTAKYRVIGEYERRLPTSPYWSAEWAALGKGEDPKLYLPLTHIENYIPLAFALLYVIGAIGLIL